MLNKLFVERPTDAIGFLEKPMLFVDKLKGNKNTTITGVKDTMVEVWKLVELKRSADFDRCVQVAREYYDSLFDH